MRTQSIIVLDPGHGGAAAANGSRPNNAQGANGLQEKDLNLSVAQYCKRQLERSGYHVILTREADVNVPLVARAERAQRAGADIFVSIHFNGHPDTSIDGTEVYIPETDDEHDKALALNILNAVSLSGQLNKRGVHPANFVVLNGDHHVPKTACVLVEMAFLSHPARARRLQDEVYLQQLGLALAQGIMSHRAQTVHAQALSAAGERVIYEVERDHEDPQNVPIPLPEPDNGVDKVTFVIPEGLKQSRWEVEIVAQTAGASYEVKSAPQTGATGEQHMRIAWAFPPFGRIKYKLRVFASPDARTEPITITYGSPHWKQRAEDQFKQGVPVNMRITGHKAKVVYDGIQRRQAQAGQPATHPQGYSRVLVDPVVTPAIVIAVIIAVVVVVGMLIFAGLISYAMDRDYDIEDTKYKTEVGEGQTRQEHELVMNLKRQNKNAQ